MSSSYRKALLLVAVLGAAATPVWAQQTYFTPIVDVTVEANTNREMIPDSNLEDESMAYRGSLELRWGRTTARSNTELRPRITFQEFPDRSGIDPIEAFLDWRTTYRTLKTRYDFVGRYARQDAYTAEFGDARFDDFAPLDPTATSDSGIVFVGETRRRFEIGPSFDHQISERYRIGGTAQYEQVRYDTNIDNARVGYDSPYAELILSRVMSPLTQIGFGPYVTRYEADNDQSTSDGYGAIFNVSHQWSEVSGFEALVRFEQDDTEDRSGISETSSAWGFELTGTRRGRVGNLTYAVGRFLLPSSLGERRKSDEVRLQYNRPLSPRLSFDGAVRFTRDQRIDDDAGNEDRDRVRAELALTHAFTTKWSLTGGYRYAWQDFSDQSDNADNNSIYLTVRYRGLSPQR